MDAETPLKVANRLGRGGSCTATAVNKPKNKNKTQTKNGTTHFRRVNFILWCINYSSVRLV